MLSKWLNPNDSTNCVQSNVILLHPSQPQNGLEAMEALKAYYEKICYKSLAS